MISLKYLCCSEINITQFWATAMISNCSSSCSNHAWDVLGGCGAPLVWPDRPTGRVWPLSWTPPAGVRCHAALCFHGQHATATSEPGQPPTSDSIIQPIDLFLPSLAITSFESFREGNLPKKKLVSWHLDQNGAKNGSKRAKMNYMGLQWTKNHFHSVGNFWTINSQT